MRGLHEYQMRQAGPSDLDRVAELVDLRTDWLAARGSDQWSTNRDRVHARMAELIRTGQTWVLTDMSRGIVGTMSVKTQPDQDFWTPDEQQVPALYLSRLATDPSKAGQDLGGIMLRWSLNTACQWRLDEVRFDAWKTSTGLHKYYVQQGWTYLRTVDAPGRRSGALFSRPAERVDVPQLIFQGYSDNPHSR